MTSIELVAVVAVVIIGVAVIALKSRQDRTQKLRRGSSSGYYDRDMARHTQGLGGAPLDGVPGDPSVRSVSPTFASSPKRTKATRGGGKGRKQGAGPPAAPTPIPVPSFSIPDLAHARPVPAFDQVAAQNLGPLPKMPPPPPPAPPPPPPQSPPAGVAPSLPTFEQHLPPAPRPPEDPAPS